jgi:hypothetical protein
MKCICITGKIQTDLERVSDVLHQAGMKPPKPANRDELINISSWHDQTLAVACENSIANHPITNPGRLMDQLAGDIFVANIAVNVWGWADSRSTWLMEYWLHFDPRIHFILVCTLPQHMLASAVADRKEINSLDNIMDSWQSHHEMLLRFHLLNPTRSILIDAWDFMQNSQGLVSYCHEKWKLKLSANTPPPPSNRIFDPLDLYLAQQLCLSYPKAISLQKELMANFTALGEGNYKDSTAQLSTEQILIDYYALPERTAQSKKLHKANAENNIKEAHIAELTQALQEQRFLANERLEHIKRLTTNKEQILTDFASQQTETENRLNILRQENAFLLRQLHQTQEDFEDYVIQLQDVQYALVSAEERWQRMLQRNPGYCDCESIKILSAKGNTALWRIKNLRLNNRHFAEITFKTILIQNMAGFVFPHQGNESGMMKRWPLLSGNQRDLEIIPIGAEAILKRRIEIMVDLSTTDWEFLHALTYQMEATLGHAPSLTKLVEFKPSPLFAGLGRLREVIEKFPATVRYDHVDLKQEWLGSGYEHLSLHFQNLSFDGKRWTEFEFRLSCSNVLSDCFGQFPHLAFPPSNGCSPFENWFVESHDEFGAKMELRFAMPHAMDMEVWQRISPEDRRFITGLIVRLPGILTNLRDSGKTISRPWENWIQATKEIQRIFYMQAMPITPPAKTELETISSRKKEPVVKLARANPKVNAKMG